MLQLERANDWAVLWDMDGVLVDTGEVHYRTWLSIFAEMGMTLERDAFNRTFGMDNNGMLSTVLGRELEPAFVEEIAQRKEAAFRQNIRGNARLLPGVRYWLETLKSHGFLQAVASSAPQANIDVILDELDIRKYFAVVVSASDMPGKPDPAVFLEAARRLGVAPQCCTVVEDAIPGVEAARRAGMKCIAVTTTNSRGALTKADVVVDSLEALRLEDFLRI